jgi:hypothetical protein
LARVRLGIGRIIFTLEVAGAEKSVNRDMHARSIVVAAVMAVIGKSRHSW